MGADGSGNSGNVPPPFLTKTYEMVDDPSTDHVVSWSDNCCSFVVWNVADFTRDLLPQYFKHNNFSSFVRQLNTYGFHKIDPERQEFANEGFSKGNKENLRNIHRRKPSTPHNQSSQLQKEHNLIGCNDPAHAGLEEEVERLHKEKGLLLAELLKVRQQQESTEMEMESLGERLQALEERQQQIMACFVQVLGSPAAGSFAKRIEIQQIESSISLTFNKRKRLPDKEVVMGTGESWEDDEVAGKQLTRYHFSDAGDVVSSAHTVKTELDEPSYQRVLRQFASSTVNHSNETSPMSRTSGVTLWERPPEANDSAGNLLPATHSGAADCSDYDPCQSTAREEHNRAVSLSTMLDDQSRSLGHPKEREIIKVNNEVSGSNDVFWESLLTENPRLSDMDADESEDARQNERWFL